MSKDQSLRTMSWGVVVALLAGCSGSRESATSTQEAESPAATAAAPAPAPLVIADWEETQRLIAAQQGRVVVLDVWATW